MARPSKKKSEMRDKLLQVRVSESEYLAFKQAAESAGIQISAWVRQQLRDATRRQLKAEAKHYLNPEDLHQ